MISDKVLPLDNGYLLFAFLLYTNTPNGWKDLQPQVQQRTAPRCVMGTCKSKDDVFPDPRLQAAVWVAWHPTGSGRAAATLLPLYYSH